MFVYALAFVIPFRLFISETGSDSADGLSRRTAIHSFARASEILKARPGEAQIEVEGTITQSTPIEIGPEFSNATIVGKRNATISGGIQLINAHPGHFNGNYCWDIAVPEQLSPKQLFSKGERLKRTRLPATGFYFFTGYGGEKPVAAWNETEQTARFRSGELKNWKNLKDVEVIASPLWITSILPVESVDEAQGIVKFAKPSVFRLWDDNAKTGASYYVENVAEEFNADGQWYFDRTSHTIHYLPTPFEDIGYWKPIVPVAPTLIKVTGAKNLKIQNLKFANTEWSYPDRVSGDGQAAVSVPGAVQLINCSDCSLTKCDLTNLGTYAIEIGAGSTGNRIDHCQMTDLGGGGVKLDHDSESTTVTDCTIDGAGRRFAAAIGIWIGNSGHNVVTHNRIHDLFYTGISVGWSWGYGPSKAVANKIEYNDISQIGQGQLSDMGGIYTLGVSPGTTIRFNRIDNVDSRTYGGWGIYTDEGSSRILIENNVVTNTKTGLFHQHYGRENIVRNNVFAYARQDGQIIRTRQEDHQSFAFEHNVVLWKGTDLLGGAWTNGQYKFAHNLLCREDGKVTLPANDEGSIVVPSLKLSKTGVPSADLAAKIGFVPFDIAKAGPRRRIL